MATRRPKILSAKTQRGVSFVEIVVVIAIIVILSAMAVVNLIPTKKGYLIDDTASQILRFMSEANSRAISQRHDMRLELDRTNRTITLWDDFTSTQIRQELLPSASNLSFTKPATVSLPAAPFDFALPDFTTTPGIWKLYFQSNSTVTDSGDAVPQSATLFLCPVDTSGNPVVSPMLRAITIFGPTGSVRLWKYRNNALATGVN